MLYINIRSTTQGYIITNPNYPYNHFTYCGYSKREMIKKFRTDCGLVGKKIKFSFI